MATPAAGLPSLLVLNSSSMFDLNGAGSADLSKAHGQRDVERGS
jgi:hypothetical protein